MVEGILDVQRSGVIVTGGLGFLGSSLTHHLREQGHEVLVIDNGINPSPMGRDIEGDSGIQIIEADVCDNETNESVRHFARGRNVSAIYHLACLASPKLYGAFPIQTLRTSSQGTMNIVELAAELSAKLVFTSTSEVYGDPLVHPQPETYFGNVNPVSPRSVYDEGKRYAEALISAAHREWGVDIRIARLFNSYGPGMAIDDGRLVPNIMTSILAGLPITVYGDGKQTRSMCFVDDTVRGLMALESSGETTPVNLGRDDERSVLEICRLASQIAGVDCSIEFRALPIDDPRQRRPDLEKSRAVLDWCPQVDLEEGLLRTLEYYRSVIRKGAAA